jgi:hypothetical protein
MYASMTKNSKQNSPSYKDRGSRKQRPATISNAVPKQYSRFGRYLMGKSLIASLCDTSETTTGKLVRGISSLGQKVRILDKI